MMWVVPVIACAVLQWMLLQTPILSPPLPAEGDALHFTYDGPQWIQATLENETFHLSKPPQEKQTAGHITVEGTGSALELKVTLLPHINRLQQALIEQRLNTAHVEIADVIGNWYSIRSNEPWDIRFKENVHTMDLSAGLRNFALSLGPLLWLPLIALHFNNMVMPAVDMTDEATRGTRETTQILPCSPAQVLSGKVLAVCTLGLIATGGQCFAMLLAIAHSMMLMLQSIPASLLASAQLNIVWPTPPSVWQLCLVALYWMPATLAHATVFTWGAHQAPTRTAKELVTLCIASVLICGSLLAASLSPQFAFWLPLINGPAVLTECFAETQSSVAVMTAGGLNLLVALGVLGWLKQQPNTGPTA